MGITNANKEVTPGSIGCGETLGIRLSLAAEPDILTSPADIVLVLDRSTSMAGAPLDYLKAAARRFIAIVDSATDNGEDGVIGGGNRIGVVSFASTATQDTQLITSVEELNSAVNALSSGGLANHADAFTRATQLFDVASENRRIIIMFTDGITTAGSPPSPIAEAAKAQGITIYVVGLFGDNGVDVDAINSWASDPDSAYVTLVEEYSELENVFENLAENITRAGATGIVITDNVNPCFRVVSVGLPTKGTATIIDERSVRWDISELGTAGSEGAALEFTVEHIGPCIGEVLVNASVEYTDEEGSIVVFPAPTVEVVCDEPVITEPCPEPIDISVGGCLDAVEFNAGELALDALGTVLSLDVVLRSVCPNRRVALAVTVNEVDAEGIEYKRGMKTLLIPAHTQNICTDITVRCIKFVMPDALNVSADDSPLCGERNFRARFIANYVDTDFECCSDII
jgi:uncharacterized protein YegL